MRSKTQRCPWIALLLLIPLTGCATGRAIGNDARAVFTGALNPVAALSEKTEVCSEAVPTIVDGKTLEATFLLGARGGDCSSTVEMTFTRALSELAKLSKKVSRLTVGDIVSLRSLSLGDGLNLLQKLTVTKHAKRPKEPRFVFKEVNSPPPPLSTPPPSGSQLGAVRGSVTDEEGRSLEGVWVSINGDSTLTGPAGRFLLTVNPGAYEIRISADGFDDVVLPSQVVSPRQILVLNLILNATQSDNP
jgi:hypothetical protein